MTSSPSDIAIKAALEAGVLLREAFPKVKKVHLKEDNSPVTDADNASNEIITRHIREAFPDHTILSEEMPGALSAVIGDEPTWVLDPLDGTSNFIAGIPLFAIAIAYMENRETKMGLIYDPLHSEMFVATEGGGATLNGSPIHVSQKSSTKGAMLFAGRGYKDRDHDRHGQIIYTLEQETTYFRRLGTAAIMLAAVAAGRADSVILTGSQSWDVVAGALLIKEAGGKITDYCGVPWTLDSEDLVATNKIIHEQIISITHDHEAATCL
ncbi:MAG: inositol monophosphatase [Parcubacteria group bacterium]|nr:inositol monophosphatase [Parcubacteria group bacterium]